MTGAGAVHADAHPVRRRFDLARPADRSLLAAIAVAAALSLVIWSPGLGGPSPGDPAAVADDPRLARCGGTLADIEYAFAIPHARDYQAYLPAMRAPELDVDPPALVVIYRGAFPVVGGATAPPSGASTRNVCIYVGQAGQGSLNYYGEVSIAGLRAAPAGPVLVPAEQV